MLQRLRRKVKHCKCWVRVWIHSSLPVEITRRSLWSAQTGLGEFSGLRVEVAPNILSRSISANLGQLEKARSLLDQACCLYDALVRYNHVLCV